jgi:hypothetical protein
MDLAALTLERFAPHVGTVFIVVDDGRTLAELELVEATAIPTDSGDRGRPPFSLAFHGPANPAFAQQTLQLEHPILGALGLFLVPLARDADGTHYEAIFN